MNQRPLLARLLAVVGTAACSHPVPSVTPEPPETGKASPQATSPGAARRDSGAGGARGEATWTSPAASGAAAGPTAICHAGLPCVAGEVCGYHTSLDQVFFGFPSRFCTCAPSGLIDCPEKASSWDPAQMVCLAKQGPCPPPLDPATRRALASKFELACPTFSPDKTPAAERTTSAGVAQCCYRGSFNLCEGRPLLVDGVARVAGLRPGVAW